MSPRTIKNIFNRSPQKNAHTEDSLFKWKKPIYVKDDLEAFNRLLKGYGGSPNRRKNFRAGFGGGRGHAFVFPEQSQRVAFKMYYSNSMASHNEYIRHYMPQKDKVQVVEKPALFGMTEEEYDKKKIPLNFKCIISPENQDVNLEELAKSFIRRLEKHTGYSLIWRGAIHSDTEHRHAHVVINGKDKNGKDVFFNRETIVLMRLMCMNAATVMLGERTKVEIARAKLNLHKANRWTEIDEQIESLVDMDQKISQSNISMEIANRLSHLAEMRLAKHDKQSGEYMLEKGWKETLRVSGRYNTYLEEYLKDGAPLELYNGGALKGIVERVITFDKDEAWNDALVIKSGGKRIYVPVWQLHKENLQGKNVSIRDTHKNGEGKISRQVSDKDIFVH